FGISWTGQTMTLIPFPSVAARTASRPGTVGVGGADVPRDGPKLLKSEEKRFLMRALRTDWNTDNGYTDCSVQGHSGVAQAMMPSSSYTLLRNGLPAFISTPQSRAPQHAFHARPMRLLLNAESELCQLRAWPLPEASTTSSPMRSPFPSVPTS